MPATSLSALARKIRETPDRRSPLQRAMATASSFQFAEWGNVETIEDIAHVRRLCLVPAVERLWGEGRRAAARVAAATDAEIFAALLEMREQGFMLPRDQYCA